MREEEHQRVTETAVWQDEAASKSLQSTVYCCTASHWRSMHAEQGRLCCLKWKQTDGHVRPSAFPRAQVNAHFQSSVQHTRKGILASLTRPYSRPMCWPNTPCLSRQKSHCNLGPCTVTARPRPRQQNFVFDSVCVPSRTFRKCCTTAKTQKQKHTRLLRTVSESCVGQVLWLDWSLSNAFGLMPGKASS